ncbi:angiotensin-converting enzyme 2 [Tribolium castaneum]|uniref:Angiotensin-converting enzyme-related protein-like Protein n=1 Tax=Tribolium castaneum TaxID=7070 RepID=D2A565_TRICA|nr:PREDICTED: angiotensin-converting enzyme 2 [Tribolium castaneum]EFA05125.1 Angiotensin-converting enzyme-related protein-like Protein [Tribolium castaneum]|eukprot:XP_015838245.1 PREDICTED: angiotensin-converting enzyme 2 [Tribolium castaneum]
MNISPSLSKFLFILILLSVIRGQEENEELLAEIQLSNVELQDDCENVANKYKSSIIDNTFTEKITAQEIHSKLLRTQSETLRPFGDIPYDLQRNWELIVKPGDAILEEPDWSTLVSYEVGIDELIHTFKVHCKNNTKNCVEVKRGYDDLLETSRNATLRKKSWSAWQTLLSTKFNKFHSVLNLINKAARLNEFDDPKLYWEKLQDLEGAYNLADGFWDQIKPFYTKLQNYIKTRLLRFYKTTSDDIPVYLSGSNFGDDWSSIANIILPHPQIYYYAESYLNQTSIKEIYKMAEQVTKDLALGPLGPKFWANSRFNLPFCENHVVTFCSQEHSEVFTCDKTSWVHYLNSFETAIDVALRSVNYVDLARLKLRYSAIDDAIVGLGSIFAIKNLRVKGVWDYELFQNNDNEMSELLLIALRVLPKLPYYLAADKWRLEVLQNGGGAMTATWWNLRKELQGIGGVFNNETDFLGDSFIVSNRPYLSKFLGTILQFQLLEHYRNGWQYANESLAANFGNDDNFLTMLHDRTSSDWPALINGFGVYELSATPLLDYFAPLNDYLDATLNTEQVVPSTTPKPTKAQKIKTLIVKKTNVTETDEDVQNDEPEPEVPRHILEDREETPNHAMEKITVFIGVGLLAGVAAIIGFVILRKKMTGRGRTNNRRFET